MTFLGTRSNAFSRSTNAKYNFLFLARCFSCNTNHVASAELWHYRLGHLNPNYIEILANHSLAYGMGWKNSAKNVYKCESCIFGKMEWSSFPKHSESRSSQMVHSDVCGPIQVESKGGSMYIVTFIDDFSRYVTVYFLRNKNEGLS